jgi:hypothetical protein
MKQGKIRLFLDCLAAHAATGKEEVCFYFLKIFNFQKIKTNLPFLVAARQIKKNYGIQKYESRRR